MDQLAPVTPDDIISPESIAAGVDAIMTGLQRSRSISLENCDGKPHIAEAVHPWLFGNGGLLLDRMLTLSFRGKVYEPSEYMNFLKHIEMNDPTTFACAYSATGVLLPSSEEVLHAIMGRAGVAVAA